MKSRKRRYSMRQRINRSKGRGIHNNNPRWPITGGLGSMAEALAAAFPPGHPVHPLAKQVQLPQIHGQGMPAGRGNPWIGDEERKRKT